MKRVDMSTNLIVTVSKSSIHSLAHQGILVYESFHQIRDLVRSRLGDAHALLFAEPSVSKDGSAIDWYTPVQGTAKRLTDLPEEEQKAARAATLRMAQDIARIASELKHSGIASQATRGTMLELALQHPGESCMYVVGEQPLLTCWGFGPGAPGVPPQDLTRLGLAATSSKVAASQTAQAGVQTVSSGAAQKMRGFSWLWLLPLLLLFLIFFLLTASFGANPPLIPGFNFKGPALPFSKKIPAMTTPSDEIEKLRKEIQLLERALLDRAELCPPETGPSGMTPEPEEKREALTIPEKPSDMDFLRGRWLCDRGLLNKADGQPIIVLFDFDSSGKGTVTVRQYGREDCVGPAVASMNAERVLIIEAERQICPDGRGYTAETIECRRGADNRTLCLGRSATGSTWEGHVPFYKID